MGNSYNLISTELLCQEWFGGVSERSAYWDHISTLTRETINSAQTDRLIVETELFSLYNYVRQECIAKRGEMAELVEGARLESE